jgi:hypothetical protein
LIVLLYFTKSLRMYLIVLYAFEFFLRRAFGGQAEPNKEHFVVNDFMTLSIVVHGTQFLLAIARSLTN